MEGKKELYKKRALGQASREVRGKQKVQESRNKREDIIASKRNITKQVEMPKTGPKSKPAMSKEAISRLEKLKEWKKARDEAKAKAKPARKPFGSGILKSSVVSKPEQHTKPKIPSTFNKPKPVNTTKPAVKTASKQPARKTTQSSTTKPSKDKSEIKKSAPKATVEIKRPLTRSMTKTAVSKVKAESKQSCSTKIQPRTKGKPAANKKPEPKKPVRVTRSTAIMTTTETIEVASMDDTEYELPPPTVSPVSNKYNPARPSPLLRSHSAKKRRDVLIFAAPRPIEDPAWIPGGETVSDSSFTQPNFDEAFGTFSPFRFGDSNRKVEFLFRKELSFSSDSLEETTTPKARRCSLRSPAVKSVSNDEGAMIVELAKPQEEAMDTNDVSEGEKLGIDLVYFRKLHSDVTDTLTSLCEVWDKKVAAIEEEQTDGIPGDMEEGLGQVRTTVCQARLLMRQKLKQYAGLVDTAEAQSGDRKTTAEDLQGFWDMVYYQVEDVYSKFHALEALEKNGWTIKFPTPKKRKTTKKKRVVKAAATSSSGEESERQQAAREKREAQRNKLKEMKMAAKRDRAESNKENVCTPKKIKLDSPKTGSAYKEGRRRSLRVSNRSVFSPSCSGKLTPRHSYADVPVAPLISFD